MDDVGWKAPDKDVTYVNDALKKTEMDHRTMVLEDGSRYALDARHQSCHRQRSTVWVAVILTRPHYGTRRHHGRAGAR